MMYKILGLVGILIIAGCKMMITPGKSFDAYLPPSKPDYSQLDNWAALPIMDDNADAIPTGSGLEDGQAKAQSDVFYVYPTVFFGRDNWNADIGDNKHRTDIQDRPILHQASVFNGSCRVFAPYYRQATFAAFFDTSGNRKQALDLAYKDIEAAFTYYMKNLNNGQPIILAGHSQGALMVVRLIQDYFDGKPLMDQLVAAYPVGWGIKVADFEHLKPCESADEINCYCTWNTWAWDTYPPGKSEELFRGAVVTNPLNWRTDSTYAPFSLNKGALGANYKRIKPEACDAKKQGGILWIHQQKLPLLFRLRDSYHIADYNLFWMNIRENVGVRLNKYLESTKTNQH